MSLLRAQQAFDPSKDPVGAFCQHLPPVFLAGSQEGPLAGLHFAAKDLYDIAGHRTGAGNPDWLESHPPAQRTAAVVSHLLAAGADLIGKTHTDELAFSLNGENHWYGTPINVNAPGRIPGGSSNGSAAAVAAGLCDFALGTDTGGSVRAPASFCRLFGMRTSTDLISRAGLVPLAPAFDSVGWFARDWQTFARVGAVLLPDSPRAAIKPKQLKLLLPAFDAAEPGFLAQAEQLADRTGLVVTRFQPAAADLEAWGGLFRLLQVASIRGTHLAWLEAVNPRFGPGIADRFAWVRQIDPDSDDVRMAFTQAPLIQQQIDSWFDGGESLVLLPTVAAGAPLPSVRLTAMDSFRARTLKLTSIAGLGHCPQFSLPLMTSEEGLPAGLSLLGRRYGDADLIQAARLFLTS